MKLIINLTSQLLIVIIIIIIIHKCLSHAYDTSSSSSFKRKFIHNKKRILADNFLIINNEEITTELPYKIVTSSSFRNSKPTKNQQFNDQNRINFIKSTSSSSNLITNNSNNKQAHKKLSFRIGLIVPRTAFISQYKTYTQRIKDTFSQLLQLSRFHKSSSSQKYHELLINSDRDFSTNNINTKLIPSNTIQHNQNYDTKPQTSACLSTSSNIHKRLPWTNLTFNKHFDISIIELVHLAAHSSAQEILDSMCQKLIEQNVSVIVYLDNNQDQSVTSSLSSSSSSPQILSSSSIESSLSSEILPKSLEEKQTFLVPFNSGNNNSWPTTNQFIKQNATSSPPSSSTILRHSFMLNRKRIIASNGIKQLQSSRSHFIMHLADSAGIPIIAWSVTATVAQRPKKQRTLHLAPTVAHEAEAMLAIMERYSWYSFSVVSTTLAGHEDFILALRQFTATANSKSSTSSSPSSSLSSSVAAAAAATISSLSSSSTTSTSNSSRPVQQQQQYRNSGNNAIEPSKTFKMLDVITVKSTSSLLHIEEELRKLTVSESRVILLYSTKGEAIDILKVSKKLKLTKRSYAWIVAQSVIGSDEQERAPSEFHPGLLGIYFRSNHERLLDELSRAITIIAHGLERIVRDGESLEKNHSLISLSSSSSTISKEGFRIDNNSRLQQSIYWNNNKNINNNNNVIRNNTGQENKEFFQSLNNVGYNNNNNNVSDNDHHQSEIVGFESSRFKEANYKEKKNLNDSDRIVDITKTTNKITTTTNFAEWGDNIFIGKNVNSSLDNNIVTTEQTKNENSLISYKEYLEKVLSSNPKCFGKTDKFSEEKGNFLYEYFRKSSPSNVFDADGSLKDVELNVINLDMERQWKKIGCFSGAKLTIDDITWPEQAERPPSGTMEKFHLRAVFLEQPSFVNLADPDTETGECKTNRAVRCRYKVAKPKQNNNFKETLSNKNSIKSTLNGSSSTTQMLTQNNSSFIKTNNNNNNNLTLSGNYKSIVEDYQEEFEYKCCSGFCIDLMEKFATDLKFSYELYRAPDGFWGILENNTWNGMISEIIKGRADVIVSSIKINSDRQKAVEFTTPFLDTGISILVAKQTGVISKLAFLEPFDTLAWVMFICVGIPLAALSIFYFEWLSPNGFYARKKADYKQQQQQLQIYNQERKDDYNDDESKEVEEFLRRRKQIQGFINEQHQNSYHHKFSFCRTLWLVITILFGSAAHIDSPKGYTARFMSNVWATFAVVFLAVYTANLAAFMITREEYLELSSLSDSRLAYPYYKDPPLKFGTITGGNTHAVLKANKPNLYNYMSRFNRLSVEDGVDAIKSGQLDAFVYDSVVLDYMASQDSECKLVNVGSWYSMTGYALAFPKNSRYYDKFNMKLLEYRKNGELDRLRRFWLQGLCKPGQNRHSISKPLDISQFMSAFLLLGAGILCSVLILALEHLYIIYVRDKLINSKHREKFIAWLYPFSLSLTDTLRLPSDSVKNCYDINKLETNKEIIELKSDYNIELKKASKQHFSTDCYSRIKVKNLLSKFDMEQFDQERIVENIVEYEEILNFYCDKFVSDNHNYYKLGELKLFLGQLKEIFKQEESSLLSSSSSSSLLSSNENNFLKNKNSFEIKGTYKRRIPREEFKEQKEVNLPSTKMDNFNEKKRSVSIGSILTSQLNNNHFIRYKLDMKNITNMQVKCLCKSAENNSTFIINQDANNINNNDNSRELEITKTLLIMGHKENMNKILELSGDKIRTSTLLDRNFNSTSALSNKEDYKNEDQGTSRELRSLLKLSKREVQEKKFNASGCNQFTLVSNPERYRDDDDDDDNNNNKKNYSNSSGEREKENFNEETKL